MCNMQTDKELLMARDDLDELVEAMNKYAMRAEWGGPSKFTEKQHDFFIDCGVTYIYRLLTAKTER